MVKRIRTIAKGLLNIDSINGFALGLAQIIVIQKENPMTIARATGVLSTLSLHLQWVDAPI